MAGALATVAVAVAPRSWVLGVDNTTATVSVNLVRVGSVYVGPVTVSDIADGITATTSLAVTNNLTVSSGLISATSSGLYRLRLYTLVFTIRPATPDTVAVGPIPKVVRSRRHRQWGEALGPRRLRDQSDSSQPPTGPTQPLPSTILTAGQHVATRPGRQGGGSI